MKNEKKTFAGGIGSLLGGIASDNAQTSETSEPKTKHVGRPKSKPVVVERSAQRGLQKGLTRMTFIVREEFQDKVRYISYHERMSIKDIFDEALRDYIDKYESAYGKIDVND